MSQAARNQRNFGWCYKKYGRVCVYCGDYADTIDHLIPHAFGGDNSRGNLVPACGMCNCFASDMIFNDFAEKWNYIRGQRVKRKLPLYDTPEIDVWGGTPPQQPEEAEPKPDDRSWEAPVLAFDDDQDEDDGRVYGHPEAIHDLCAWPSDYSGEMCGRERGNCTSHMPYGGAMIPVHEQETAVADTPDDAQRAARSCRPVPGKFSTFGWRKSGMKYQVVRTEWMDEDDLIELLKGGSAQTYWETQLSPAADLAGDGGIGDLGVVGEEEGLAQDEAEHRVVVEREEQLARAGVPGRDDA